MAHFAKIIDNMVVEVVVVNNDILLNKKGLEQESLGIKFCQSLYGGDWVQTSFNATTRGKFAGIGDIWDGKNFIVIGDEVDNDNN